MPNDSSRAAVRQGDGAGTGASTTSVAMTAAMAAAMAAVSSGVAGRSSWKSGMGVSFLMDVLCESVAEPEASER
ncbi:hypothetical protein D3C87_2156840 [compost metagenome]